MFSIHVAASLFYYTGKGDGEHELAVLDVGDKRSAQANDNYYIGRADEGPLAPKASWAGTLATNLGLRTGSPVALSDLASLWFGYKPDGKTPLSERVPTYAEQARAQKVIADAEARLFSTRRAMQRVRDRLAQAGIRPKEIAAHREVVAIQKEIDSAKEDLGRAVKSPNYRTPAHDLTFSAPKSVSIAWAALRTQGMQSSNPGAQEAIRRADAIEACVLAAARETCVDLIEPHFVFSRHGSGSHNKGAQRRYENVRGLAFAMVQHFESRPTVKEATDKAEDGNTQENSSGAEDRWRMPDPQLHVHALMMAMCQDYEDNVRAVHQRFLGTHAHVIGAAFRANLAAKLRDAGFSLRETDAEKINAFEIEGVTDQQIGEFSSRRRVVQSGIAMGKTGQQAVLQQREAKRDYQPEEMLADWNARLAECGVQVESTLAQTAGGPRRIRDRGELVSEAIANLLSMKPELRLADISLKAHELAQHASLEELADSTPLQWAQAFETAVITDPRLRVTGRLDEHGRPVFTSSELTTHEHDLYYRSIPKLAATEHRDALTADTAKFHIADTEKYLARSKKVERFEFADFQRLLVEEMLTSRESIRVALAPAGCGKTTAALAACRGFEASGMRFIPLAPSNQAASKLAEDLHKAAADGLTPQRLLGRIEQGKTRLTSKDVLFVDEASMLDFDTARALVAAALAAEGGPARLILMGDTEQLPAVARGNFLRRVVEDNERQSAANAAKSVVRRVIESAQEWSKIARQKNDIGKQATALLAMGENRAALEIYEQLGAVELFDTREDAASQLVFDAMDSLATQAVAMEAAVGPKARAAAVADFQRGLRSMAILASTRADVANLNRLTRAHLVRIGYYGMVGEQRATLRRGMAGTMEIRQGERIILTAAVMPEPQQGEEAAPGDKSRSGRRLNKSTAAVVRRIEKRKGKVYLTLGIDGTDPPRLETIAVEDFSGIDYGYATTIHRSQGATVDRTYELFGRYATRELDYVGKSRWREAHKIYGAKHEFEAYKNAIGKPIEKTEALDLGGSDLSAFAPSDVELDRLQGITERAKNELFAFFFGVKRARARHLTQGRLIEFGVREDDHGGKTPFAILDIAGTRQEFSAPGLLDRFPADKLSLGSYIGLEAVSPERGKVLSGVSWRWHSVESLAKAGLLADEESILRVAAGPRGSNEEAPKSAAALARARQASLGRSEKAAMMSATQQAATFRSLAAEHLRAAADAIREMSSVREEETESIDEATMRTAWEWLPKALPAQRSRLAADLERHGIVPMAGAQLSTRKDWLGHLDGVAFARAPHGAVEAWPIKDLPDDAKLAALSRGVSIENERQRHLLALSDAEAAASELQALASSVSPGIVIRALDHDSHGICIALAHDGLASQTTVVRAMFHSGPNPSESLRGREVDESERRWWEVKNLKTHKGFSVEDKVWLFPIQSLQTGRIQGSSDGSLAELRSYLARLAEAEQKRIERKASAGTRPKNPDSSTAANEADTGGGVTPLSLAEEMGVPPETPHITSLSGALKKGPLVLTVQQAGPTALLLRRGDELYVAERSLLGARSSRAKVPKRVYLSMFRGVLAMSDGPVRE